MGLRVIPFDREVEGLSLESELWENWSVSQLAARPLLAPISPSKLLDSCKQSLDKWGVRYSSTKQTAAALSGGNAQKLVLAREIDSAARMVVAAQPTRGLDIGATEFVWESLNRAKANGCGVLLISTDLDELFGICDRIAVILSGRITADLSPPFDYAATGRAMTGA